MHVIGGEAIRRKKEGIESVRGGKRTSLLAARGGKGGIRSRLGRKRGRPLSKAIGHAWGKKKKSVLWRAVLSGGEKKPLRGCFTEGVYSSLSD